MTAIYTWRMIFRAFLGKPNEQAEALAHGHLWHAEQPTNPANGEVEDTDVGFPGTEHHIAEKALPMKIAMSVLMVLAVIGGIVLHPEDDDVAGHLPGAHVRRERAPARPVGRPAGLRPRARCRARHRRRRRGLGDLGQGRGRAGPHAAGAAAPVHRLLVNKWYFDELIELVVLKPWGWFGRFGQQTFERVFVNGLLIGAPSGLVRAGSAAVRALQSGFLRAYAGAAPRRPQRRHPLLPAPVVTIHLSIILWLPLAAVVLGLLAPGASTKVVAIVGGLLTFAYTIVLVADFDRSLPGLQYVTDETWIAELGIHYKLGVDGLNLFLIALAAFIFLAAYVWIALLRLRAPRARFFFFLGLAESAVLGALMAQDLALFVLFFDLCSSRSSS